MINKIYDYTVTDSKVIEKIVSVDVVMINHMVLPKDECLPVHKADSTLFMIVARGAVTLILDESPPETFSVGSIINIEYGTLMSVCNRHEDILELFVVKAPGPSHYKK